MVKEINEVSKSAYELDGCKKLAFGNRLQEIKKNKFAGWNQKCKGNCNTNHDFDSFGGITENLAKLSSIIDSYKNIKTLSNDEVLCNTIREIINLHDILKNLEVRYNGIVDWINVVETYPFPRLNDEGHMIEMRAQLKFIDSTLVELVEILIGGYAEVSAVLISKS